MAIEMEKEKVFRPRRQRIGESGGERPQRRVYTSDKEGGYRREDGFRKSEGGYRKSEGGFNREGGFRKSEGGYRKSEGSFNKEGGFRKSEGGFRKEGGYRKSEGSFNREGGFRKSEGGFRGDRKPRREGGFKSNYRPQNNHGINRMIDQRKKQFESQEFSDNDHTPVPVKDVVRLNKFMANSGICSRREADTFIQAGVVTVNGEVVTELGTKINIYTDDVRFNGEKLKGEEKVYILMNKPKGYVTTTADPHAEKTVMELLRGCNARVFSVGRLDKNTTGVLMFTNDGEMAEKLTHPSYDKKKIYQVNLDKDLKREDFENILKGIELNDGLIAADDLQYIDAEDRRKIGIEIHSGKNRIVRRIFESLGYDVKALDRVYFAGLTKKGLKRGEWRFLTEGETNILKMGAFK